MPTPKAVVEAWGAAGNARDAQAAASRSHDDAITLQVALGAPTAGRQAMHDDWVTVVRAFPDTYTHIEQLLQDGEWAILQWSGGGTWQGELAGRRPSGHALTLRGCGFCHVTEGKMQVQRGDWDKATWFGQLGLPVEG